MTKNRKTLLATSGHATFARGPRRKRLGRSTNKCISSITCIPILIAFFLSPGILFAQDETKQDSPKQSTADSAFTKADKNGDGRLGPDEVKNTALFKRMDTDSDGFVTQKEAQAQAKRRRARENAAVAAAAEEVSNKPVFPANANRLQNENCCQPSPTSRPATNVRRISCCCSRTTLGTATFRCMDPKQFPRRT